MLIREGVAVSGRSGVTLIRAVVAVIRGEW